MNFPRKKILLVLFTGAVFCFWQSPAEATRSFTATQVTSPALLTMGTTTPMSITITNTSTAGETMTKMQFNVSGTYTYFPPQTITLAGWTCTLSRASGGNYRRIICSANATSNYITQGGSETFTFNIINNATLTTDSSDDLSSVVGSFRVGTRTQTATLSNQGSWTWKALSVTLVPSSPSVGTGCQFNLTMTVTNKTNTTLSNIASVLKPPSPSYTGGASVITASNPANLTLATGATGTLVWVYTLTGSTGNTVQFSACASTGASCTSVSGTSRTSASVTSSAVSVASGLSCGLNAAITNNPACLFPGGTATFVMTVTNTTGNTVSNVVPSALTPVVSGATIGIFSGPTPSSIANIANNGNGIFTWTAPITGSVNATYAVQGYATANGPLQTATVTSNVQDIDGYIVPPPGPGYAGSTNDEITWTVTNYGCSNINQVSIAVPGGWTLGSDAYAIVYNIAGNQVEWNAAGTTFTAQSAPNRIPPTTPINTGTFCLVFSQTPAAAGTYIFNVTITDDSTPTPVVQIIPTTVTVNPYNSSTGPNAVDTAIWHEEIQ